MRTVVADVGYWSKDNVATSGVEALIAPGKTYNLDQQIHAETQRAEVLARVERDELSIIDAAAELGLGRSRIDQLLVARRRGLPPTPAVAMVAKLATPRGRRLYKKRCATSEPIFGQTKHNRGIRRFARRGLGAVDSEWKLIATTPTSSSPAEHEPALRLNRAGFDLTQTPTGRDVGATASERAIWRG